MGEGWGKGEGGWCREGKGHGGEGEGGVVQEGERKGEREW